MASHYDIGDVVRLTATFLSTGSTAIDPTEVTFYIEKPGSTVAASTFVYSSSTEITRASAGVYYVDVSCTGSGAYEYRFTSTGTAAASEEGFFYVRGRRVTT